MNRVMLVLLTATGMGVLPCAADLDAELTQTINDLRSGNAAKMLAAKVALEGIRPRLVTACTEILNDQSQDRQREQWMRRQSVRNVAIEMLGKLKAEEATDLLIQNLRAPPDVPKTSWPFKGYPPAVDALARIGKPATAGILKAMASAEDEDTLRGLGLALIQIEGYEGGEKLVERAVQMEKDEQQQTRLQAAHARYLKLPKSLPQPGYDD